MKIIARAIRTRYWKPNDDYRKIILDVVAKESHSGDVVAISEKALAVALGRIVDESRAKPGRLARSLAGFWMRLIWGFVLSWLCHLKPVNIVHLRNYPRSEGAKHKQVCLEHCGLLQALLPFSEGGIDTTNLPFSLASLPLEYPRRIAEEIRAEIADKLEKDVIVTIVDSDKTYSFCGVHFASRATDVSGIYNIGLLAYVAGRSLKWKARSTPLAWAGSNETSEYMLRVAGLANKARGHGAGRTTWDMAGRFGVGLTEVNWEMLGRVEHKPLVILRSESDKPAS